MARRVPVIRKNQVIALCLAVALVSALPTRLAAAPEGQMNFAAHVTLAPRWLDPAETESAITPFMVLYAIHDALVKPMPGGLTTPSLAESWTVSKDDLTYEFVLRSGPKFHNGDPVTADDVKFSFERYRGGAAKLLKERVREVRVVDPRRVRFVLKEPWPDFLTFYGTTATGAGWIVPKKYVEKVGDAGFQKAPIGAGPYRFVSVNPGIELTLEAFEGYWRKVPSVKRLVLKSVPDETTRAAALKRGEVDVAYFLNGPIAEDVRRTPGLKLMAVRTNTVFFLDFVDQWDPKSPWHDQRVRLAASLAIDRKAINEAESLGFSGLTGNIVPRHMEFALPIDPHPYDPKRAKQLLTEAGYANGFDAGDITPNPPYFSMAEAVGHQPGRGRDPHPPAGPSSARPSSPPGGRRSSTASSSARRAPAATRPRGSRGWPRRTASTPTACCPRWRTSSSARPASSTRRSARSCSTRSSASSTSAWSSRRSGRTASSGVWARGRRSRP